LDAQIVAEASMTLRFWSQLLRSAFMERQHDEAAKLKGSIVFMLKTLKEMTNAPNSVRGAPFSSASVGISIEHRPCLQELQQELKRILADTIEEGRRSMGLDVFIRRPDGSLASEYNTPVLDLFEEHHALDASKWNRRSAASMLFKNTTAMRKLKTQRDKTKDRLSVNFGSTVETQRGGDDHISRVSAMDANSKSIPKTGKTFYHIAFTFNVSAVNVRCRLRFSAPPYIRR
jgi:hypothetical protein